MAPVRTRSLGAFVAFVAYVAATAFHIGFVVAHEPFSFDAWNVAIDTGAQSPTIGRFFAYWQYEYAHSNPRLGQPLTYLAYKLDWFAELVTPLAYLALTLGITVLGLGRRPKRGRELALWAMVIGFCWFALPQIGRNMFCRAYAANYIYGAAIQLWFLVPLRLRAARPDAATTQQCLTYAMAGALAGICNEHTGPALIAFLAGYAWWLHRANKSARLPIAGAIGVLIGFAALLFAPGQGERYGGLARRHSLLDQVLDRGVSGGLEIFRDYLVYTAPLLGVLTLILIYALATRSDRAEPEHRAAQRRALGLIVLALAAGVAIAATLSASPKLGSRFYIAPLALLLAGLVALIDATVSSPRRLAPLVVLAVLASAFAVLHTVPLFRTVAAQGAARMAALEASTPGSVFVVDTFDQVGESWWFIGDDFRDIKKRVMVARYFGLARVSLRGSDPKALLGIQGVRVETHYQVKGATATEGDGGCDLGAVQGRDLRAIHRETQASIDCLRDRIAPAELERVELAVAFDGVRPPLPRDAIAISRWRDGSFEGYAASVAATDGGAGRTIEIPAELAGKDIYVVRVGGEVKKLGTADGAPLRYSPWRRGVYWVLACDAAACLVIAVTRY